MQTIYETTKDIDGWLLPDETQALYDLAREFGDVILEVGTFRGRSATVLTSGASSRRRPQFFSLDVNPAAGILAKDILKERGLADRAVFFHGTLADFRKQFPVTPTMAFIDGDHTYEGVLADVTELSTFMPPNAPIVFHDYFNRDTPGVSRAVDEWCEQGFAKKVRSLECSIQVRTTSMCRGERRAFPDAEFRKVALAAPRRSFKERIGLAMPWLVPVVRRLRGKA